MQKIDPRTLQTKAEIKNTLLDMLVGMAFEKVTVTQLCKQAGINRGTFYLHYCDLYAVLEELMEKALHECSPQATYHCSLTAEHYQCPYGICDKIHTRPEYGVIFFDDSLSSRVIDKIAEKSKDKYIASLTEQLALTPEQAETIFYFQLNGYLAVNKRIYREGSKDWKASRDLIGGFIQSGLKRYLSFILFIVLDWYRQAWFPAALYNSAWPGYPSA